VPCPKQAKYQRNNRNIYFVLSELTVPQQQDRAAGNNQKTGQSKRDDGEERADKG
jgi:hypothetical protein